MPKPPTKTRQPLSLEDATALTIAELGGAPACAAMPGIRVGKTSLFKYADDSEENRGYTMPMDVAAVLSAEQVRQGLEPHLLRWLEAQVEPHMRAEPLDASLSRLTARLGKESSDVFADLGAVLDPAGDGGAKMTPREREKLLGDLADVQRVVLAGLAALKRAA